MKTLTAKKQLEHLRECFKYHADGTPDIYSFGDFKRGVTTEEIDSYLRVRAGQMNIKGLRKKYDKIFGVNTVTGITVTGSILAVDGPEKTTVHATLYYRSDVQRFADVLFEGKPTFFD